MAMSEKKVVEESVRMKEWIAREVRQYGARGVSVAWIKQSLRLTSRCAHS